MYFEVKGMSFESTVLYGMSIASVLPRLQLWSASCLSICFPKSKLATTAEKERERKDFYCYTTNECTNVGGIGWKQWRSVVTSETNIWCLIWEKVPWFHCRCIILLQGVSFSSSLYMLLFPVRFRGGGFFFTGLFTIFPYSKILNFLPKVKGTNTIGTCQLSLSYFRESLY